MSSFYGGKQGRTYHIVARYDCVNLNNFYTEQYRNSFINFTEGTYNKGDRFQKDGEYYFVLADNGTNLTESDLTNEEKVYHIRGMVQQFAKGGAYTEANYGEYVLIDTIFNLNHKSDLENGLLYRRGFDYNQSLNEKPNINNSNYYDNGNLIKDVWQAAWDAWVQKPGAGAIYVGQIVGPQGDSPEVVPVEWDESFAINSVQGSFSKGKDIIDEEIVYNDEIRIGSYTERDSDGNVTGAKIAFDIPQTIFDPPSININGTTYQGFAEENDISEDHPFYYKWNFYMPQATDFELETGQAIGSGTDGQGNSIVDEDTYITYKVNNVYDENEDELIEVEHLGRWPYRVIDNIYLPQVNRNFVIFDSENEENITANIGDLYNFNISSEDDNYLICAVCIQSGLINSSVPPKINADNNINSDYDPGYQSQSNETIWRVVEIPKTAPANSLIVNYKAGINSEFYNQLRSVDYFTLAENGDLYVKYSDSLDEVFKLGNINGLRSITINDNGILVEYINGKEERTNLKWINSIQLENQDDITNINRQKFTVTYKNGNTEPISNAINTILAIEMQGDNIVVLYSDPEYRQQFEDRNDTVENKDYFKRNWTDPVTGTSYTNLTWVNLTSPKGSYHVQGEYTYSDLEGNDTALDYTVDLSHGFGDIPDLRGRVGWLVTVQDGTTKRIYAYDYNDTSSDPNYLGKYTFPDGTATHWYEIFSLAASQVEPELSVVIESQSNPPTNKLNLNGLWFVTYTGHDNI